MKRKQWIIVISIWIIVSIASVLYLRTRTSKEVSLDYGETEKVETNVVKFKMKYGIELANDWLLPEDIEITYPAKLTQLAKEQNKIFKLNMFVYKDDIVSDFTIIELYPKESIPLQRFSFKDVDADFFKSRGLTDYMSKKVVKTFQESVTLKQALQKLKSSFKSGKNKLFYEEAFTKLLF